MKERLISESSDQERRSADFRSRGLRSILAHEGESYAGPRRPGIQGRRMITIDCDATISEAIAKLVQNNIGSLPVVDNGGNLTGIFSERDVLRIIHNRGEGFGRLRVSEVMTRDPVTCQLDDDVADVMGR